jgi:hypothetical protein
MARVSSVRIELNRAGIHELLTSVELQQHLNSLGEQVADAAASRAPIVGEGLDNSEPGIPLPINVESSGGKSRARTVVIADHWAGVAVEAKHRLLVGALDAARS